MTVSAIGFNGNNDWMKKKLLDRQAQKGMQPQGQEQVQQNQQVQDSQTQNVDSANKASAAMGAQGPQEAPPWASMMSELGLKATGSKEGDIAAIGSKIENMRSEATSPADKAELQGFETEYQNMQAMASSLQQPTQPQDYQGSPTQGQEQLADLNKLMLVKQKLI